MTKKNISFLRDVRMNSLRAEIPDYVNPAKEVNAGIWSLFAGATVFLFLRIYCKISRRTGLWYDDHMLLLSWVGGLNYSCSFVLRDADTF